MTVHRINPLDPGRCLLAAAALALAGACTGPAGSQSPSAAEATAATASQASAPESLYQCPMHPSVTADEPGDCPICGMRLVEVDGERMGAGGGDDEHDRGSGSGEPHGPAVSGRATVTIEPRRLEQLGVRIATAELTTAVRTIPAVGIVEPTADRLEHVHTKVGGWLERVQVQAVGDPVGRGQVLYELYSPELIATQEELLSAVAGGNETAAAAARQRLRYWDVSPRDIAAIEAGGQAWRRVPFRSPIDGYIHASKAVEGMHVQQMTDVYRLMNLDRVWVVGKFHQSDLEHLRVGAAATVRLPSGRQRAGEVAYVEPTVDRQTRFVSARLELDNPELALRPGMYVDVRYAAELGPALVVPDDAVLRTGRRALAFVDLGGGRFEPRELELGPLADGGTVVYGGLAPGERVVEQATFFIDSESSLKAALSKLRSGGHNH